jgi:hypothetical protein
MTDHPQAAIVGATPKLEASATLHWVCLGLILAFLTPFKNLFCSGYARHPRQACRGNSKFEIRNPKQAPIATNSKSEVRPSVAKAMEGKNSKAGNPTVMLRVSRADIANLHSRTESTAALQDKRNSTR